MADHDGAEREADEPSEPTSWPGSNKQNVVWDAGVCGGGGGENGD